MTGAVFVASFPSDVSPEGRLIGCRFAGRGVFSSFIADVFLPLTAWQSPVFRNIPAGNDSGLRINSLALFLPVSVFQPIFSHLTALLLDVFRYFQPR